MSRILVIDDEAEIVTLVSEVLRSAGYEVRGLANSREGEEVFRIFEPDLCLLDFRMPELTGADLFRQFKAIDPLVETIFLTAEAETTLAIDLMKAGAIDYLLKPFDMGQLMAAVRRALEHRQLLRENVNYRNHLESLVAERTAALNDALRGLKHIHEGTLSALSTALDFRDQSTSGHSQRVAQWTTGIARTIGISGEELHQIEQGSLLHDIGKLKIPDSVLLKPGPLDKDQWLVMRRHPEYGRDFLANIDFLRSASKIVYTHHEKFDGSGYPQGLRREKIPIGARCFAIVDAVDAMIFKRPYNQPISFEQASDEVMRCSGSHFDPELIRGALDFLSSHIPKATQSKQASRTA